MWCSIAHRCCLPTVPHRAQCVGQPIGNVCTSQHAQVDRSICIPHDSISLITYLIISLSLFRREAEGRKANDTSPPTVSNSFFFLLFRPRFKGTGTAASITERNVFDLCFKVVELSTMALLEWPYKEARGGLLCWVSCGTHPQLGVCVALTLTTYMLTYVHSTIDRPPHSYTLH